MSYTPWYAPVIGYGFSVFAEAILVKSLVETLWDCIVPQSSSNPQNRPQFWQGDALARIEGVLYVAFLQLGLGNLIGVWLVLKVAGQWKRWMDDGDEKTQRPDGRSVFNIFLIGNALSVLYSFVGFKLIGWIQAERVLQVCWVSLTVIVLTLAFWAWIPGQRKSRFL